MDININVNKEDMQIEKILQRFIKYAEENMTTEPNAEKIITIDDLRNRQKKSDPSNDYMNNVAMYIGDAIFGIITLKISIATGVTMDAEDSGVDFNGAFGLFKSSITHAEDVYKAEGKNIYDQPLFTVIDVITTIASHKIIDAYFKQDESAPVEPSSDKSEPEGSVPVESQ